MDVPSRIKFKEIPRAIAAPFIEKWHYSAVTPTGKNVFFGAFVEEELYAVADYGIGVNQVQDKYLAKVSGCDVRRDNMYELKRLCRIEPRRNDVQLTQFLSICHRLLLKKNIEFIVSFSDPTYNRFKEKNKKKNKADPNDSGGIYRAAGFRYMGKTNPEWHVVDKDGKKHHRRVAYLYNKRHGGGTGRAAMVEARAILGFTREKTEAKDRWFLPLRNADKKVLDTKLSNSV